MIFLNTDSKFTEVKTKDYEFYHYGSFNLSIDDIIHKLLLGNFPSNIKGNFAFVFKDKSRTVLAVDHLPTTNLFYGLGYIGHIYLSLVEELESQDFYLNLNNPIRRQIDLYWGGSVGQETTYKQIKRVLSGCYLEIFPDGKEKITEYRNLYTHFTDPNFNVNELSDVLENFISKTVKNNQNKYGLLYSSGTDSNTLLGFFRKLNLHDNCKLISIRGKKEYQEEALYIEKISNSYGLKPNWYTLSHVNNREFEKFAETTNDNNFKLAYQRTHNAYWLDPHAVTKYLAVNGTNNQDCVIFTGEVGDQIFGSRFGKVLLKYILQRPNHSVEELAYLFLNCDRSRFKQIGVFDKFSNYSMFPNIIKCQEMAVEWFVNTWNKIQTDDLVNKIELLHYLYKGSHRIYNYSQFTDLKFAHPFADSDVFDLVWKIPGKEKIGNNGKTRMLSYNLIKDHVLDLSWTLPKTGVAIFPEELHFETARKKYTSLHYKGEM